VGIVFLDQRRMPQVNCTAENTVHRSANSPGKEAKGTAKQRKSTRRVAWELQAMGQSMLILEVPPNQRAADAAIRRFSLWPDFHRLVTPRGTVLLSLETK
jgi:hypothetical protein